MKPKKIVEENFRLGKASKESVPVMSALDLEVKPGQSIELLKELHIVTRDGKLNQDSRRKLKQVHHLFQFIEKPLQDLSARPECGQRGVTLVDHGAGKSYLGFVVYDLFFKQMGLGHVYSIETRTELIQKSRELACRLGFDRMSFLNMAVADAADCDILPTSVDMVTALHACDSATDDAIAFGLKKNAQYMVLVPCCQAELARYLNQNKAFLSVHTPLSELWRHPLHAREIGSQVTNVLRCLYLEASGYQVMVTELVGWEHSMKNELIIARRVGRPQRAAAQRLRAIAQELGVMDWVNSRCRSLSVEVGDNATPV